MILNVFWTEYQIREAWEWYETRGFVKKDEAIRAV